jgi:hypothetical protein
MTGRHPPPVGHTGRHACACAAASADEARGPGHGARGCVAMSNLTLDPRTQASVTAALEAGSLKPQAPFREPLSTAALPAAHYRVDNRAPSACSRGVSSGHVGQGSTGCLVDQVAVRRMRWDGRARLR